MSSLGHGKNPSCATLQADAVADVIQDLLYGFRRTLERCEPAARARLGTRRSRGEIATCRNCFAEKLRMLAATGVVLARIDP